MKDWTTGMVLTWRPKKPGLQRTIQNKVQRLWTGGCCRDIRQISVWNAGNLGLDKRASVQLLEAVDVVGAGGLSGRRRAVNGVGEEVGITPRSGRDAPAAQRRPALNYCAMEQVLACRTPDKNNIAEKLQQRCRENQCLIQLRTSFGLLLQL